MLVLRALVIALVLADASATAAHAPLRPAAVRVTQIFVGPGRYIEGSFSYLRVGRIGGGYALQRRLVGYPRASVRLSLAPGRYRLRSWQRPCDGNCSVLDPPIDRCSGDFRVTAGRAMTATIRVTPTRGCRITFR